MLLAAIVRTTIDLLYEHPSVSKTAELRGASWVETFFNHGLCYLVLTR